MKHEDRSVSGRQEFETLRLADPATATVPPHGHLLALSHAKGLPGAYRSAKQAEQLHGEEWTFRGPANISGRTRAFAIDNSNERVVLAGSVSGGLYRSEDAGLTWVRTTEPNMMHNIASIVQDPRQGHESEWYFSCGEATGSAAFAPGDGIWKSIDGGRTWVVLPSTKSGPNAGKPMFWYSWRLVVHPSSDSTRLFLASPNYGILMSADGGETWKISLGSTSIHMDLVCTTTGVLYAGIGTMTNGLQSNSASRSGIWRSQDTGRSWDNVSPEFFPDTVRRVVLAIAPSDERQIYAVASTPGVGQRSSISRNPWHSLWKYHADIGWSDLSGSMPVGDSTFPDFNSQGGYDLLCDVSPVDTNLVILGGTNLYRSTNGFQDPTTTTYIGGYSLPRHNVGSYGDYPNHHPDQHLIRRPSSNADKLYSLNDGGVYLTENVRADTVQWRGRNEGYYTSQFYAIAIRQDANDPLLIGGMQDRSTYMTHTMDGSTPWVWREGSDGGFCFIIGDGRELIVSTQEGHIIRKLLDSTGKEIGWTRLTPKGGKDYLFINPFDVDPNDPKRIYTAGGYILWRNNDVTAVPMENSEPTEVNWDSLANTRSSGRISAVTVSTEPANIVWYGTSTGAVYKLTDANEGSQMPERVDSGMPSNAFVSCVALDDRDANHVMVSYSSYFTRCAFASTDGGQTWSDVSGNLRGLNNTGPIVNWCRIHPRGEGSIYLLATATGTYYAVELNGDQTVWIQAGADVMGTVPVRMIRSRASDDLIAIGTHGNGVYSGRITSLPAPTPAPTLLSPPNQSRGVHPDTVLTWGGVSGAVAYDVDISTSEDFSSAVVSVRGVTASRLVVRNLVQGPTTYYWRVFAYGPGGRSTANVNLFSTAVRPPDVVSPANREENVGGLPVVLTWTRIPEALTYDVEVSTNLTFNTIVAKANNVRDTTVGINGLAGNTRYFWHVRSTDADTSGVWCQRSQFTTGVLTSVQDEPEEETFVVSPNPAADKLIFTVPVPTGSVEIVDLDGRVVATVNVTETSTWIDLRTLATGTYTVRYTNGRVTSTQSIQIVR